MTKEEIVAAHGLCAVCANRETCEDEPKNMSLSCCTAYADDGGTEYEVAVEGAHDEGE